MKRWALKNQAKLVCILLTISTLLAGCGSHSEAEAGYTALAASIDDAINAEVEGGFSGVVLVGAGNGTILEKAYGELKGHRYTTDTRFRISSTAKQFESTAILRTRDMGLLRLDDPLSKFFPEAPSEKKNITVRQLLTHQSGFGQSYVSEQVMTGEEAATAILAEPLAGTPEDGFRYSNNNYQLAAAIVEIVTGEDYQAFLTRELLRPSGLKNTGQGSPENNASIAPTLNPLPVRLRVKYWGGQGMYSTASDLFRWINSLRSGDVLPPASLEDLFRPATTISEGFGAMGWFGGETESGVRRIFTRGNDDYGPNSLIYFYPDEDVTIIVLTHAGDKNSSQSYSRAVHAMIEDILFAGDS